MEVKALSSLSIVEDSQLVGRKSKEKHVHCLVRNYFDKCKPRGAVWGGKGWPTAHPLSKTV